MLVVFPVNNKSNKEKLQGECQALQQICSIPAQAEC